MEKDILVVGEVGIEKEAMEAFREYKEANEIISTKATVSQFDRDDLQTKENEYLAMKKAKRNMMQ